jgi:DNA-directed RNA polymerase subunit K/omega
MVVRSSSVNMYEFVVVSALRTHQLMSGCTPRVDGGHKATTVAQMEVAAGKVARVGALQLHEA